jgi:hypothetical protein
MQTRLGSIVEAVLNVVVGFGVAVTAQIIVFPIFLGVRPDIETNLLIGLVFTAISLIRSYILRRLLTGNRWLTERENPDA